MRLWVINLIGVVVSLVGIVLGIVVHDYFTIGLNVVVLVLNGVLLKMNWSLDW